MVMQENYQPVILRKILLSNGLTREEIEEELRKHNPDSSSQSMTDTVLTVLQRNHIIKKENNKFLINSFHNLSDVETQELVDACNKRIEEFQVDDDTRFFIALGPWSNWEHTLNNPPFRWGVNPSSASNVGVFNALRPGDIVYFYANKDNPTPFSKRGLFGVGKVIRTYDENSELYWPDEKLKNEVIYKRRFEIKPYKIIQSDSDLLPWIDGLPFTKGLNRIANKDTLKQLVDNTERLWDVKLMKSETSVFLSEDDFEKMVDAIALVTEYNKSQLINSDSRIPNPQNIQLCARLQYYCALRIAELLKLTPRDIDLDKYEIKIRNRNDPNLFSITTIHPAIKNELAEYLNNHSQNDVLFPFTRQLLWSYYKKAGTLAELNLFKEQNERKIEGMSTSILRESRGRHMLEKGAGEGLTRLKLRQDNDDSLFRFDEHTLQELKEWEKKEYEELTQSKTQYLLLRHKPGSVNQWRDDIGKQYHFGKIANYTKIIPGTKTIWFDRDEGDFYYWGYGEVSKIEKESDEHFHAHYDKFYFFNDPQKENPTTDDVTPKKGTLLTTEKITHLPGWNNQMSMIEITKEIYDEIVYGKVITKSNVKIFEDEPLPVPTPEDLKKGYEKISDELLVPESKIIEIVTALASGRHVLLAGPIGTGKTRLAQIIPRVFWESIGGYYSEDYTATSDWSTQDVIAGIFPKMSNEKPIYEIQNGCVVETVVQNWENKLDGGNRCYSDSSRGTWLIIDEFNRADIDKAFGQLFTALRTRSLKIPTDKQGISYKNLKIPEDYRIIGTLNTADKHFLFQLSDALKSRFAYIEVDIPSRKDFEAEIYYAMKNAIGELDEGNYESLIVLDHDNKKLDVANSDEDFFNRIRQAYLFLDLVRIFKKLGTAILKLVYQNLLVGTKITGDSKLALDNSLKSTLIPQLENLPRSALGSIQALYSKDIADYFKNAYKNPNRQSYSEDFAKVLKYLEIPNAERLTNEFSNGTLQVDNESMWAPIKTAQEKRRNEFEQELPQLQQSMDDLIRSVII